MKRCSAGGGGWGHWERGGDASGDSACVRSCVSWSAVAECELPLERNSAVGVCGQQTREGASLHKALVSKPGC